MNVHEKIHAIMTEVGYVQKDDQVKFGSTNYKALSEEKVTSIMHEKLVKYGLVVYPISQAHHREGQITHVDVVYRIANKDDPQDYIDVVSCGDGADTQDKGSGKAMTYAYKYMWLRTFALPTGEDPDKISSAELDAKQAEAAKNPTLDNATPVQSTPETDLWVAKNLYETELRGFCQRKNRTEQAATAYIEGQIGKKVADFTKADYSRALDVLHSLGKKK